MLQILHSHPSAIPSKTPVSSFHLRKLRWNRKVIYKEELPNTVYEEMRKYLAIYEETISHI